MGDRFWFDVGRALSIALRLITLFAPVLYVISTHA